MRVPRDRKRLGKVIREQRKARGLSLEQLGDLIDMTKGNLSKVERGQVNIPNDRLRAIAKALGLEPSELHAAAEASAPTPVTA